MRQKYIWLLSNIPDCDQIEGSELGKGAGDAVSGKLIVSVADIVEGKSRSSSVET